MINKFILNLGPACWAETNNRENKSTGPSNDDDDTVTPVSLQSHRGSSTCSEKQGVAPRRDISWEAELIVVACGKGTTAASMR